jgi:hypothetical protein
METLPRVLLKPVKDLPQPSSYLPISLFDTTDKLLESILLANILNEVSRCRLLRDEHFGFTLNFKHVPPAIAARQLPRGISQRHKGVLDRMDVVNNVSKSTAILSSTTGKRIPQPRPVHVFVEPVHCVDTSRCPGFTLDIRLTWW